MNIIWLLDLLFKKKMTLSEGHKENVIICELHILTTNK